MVKLSDVSTAVLRILRKRFRIFFQPRKKAFKPLKYLPFACFNEPVHQRFAIGSAN